MSNTEASDGHYPGGSQASKRRACAHFRRPAPDKILSFGNLGFGHRRFDPVPVDLCFRVTLSRSQAAPHISSHRVFRYGVAIGMNHAQVVLSSRIPLLSSRTK